MREVCFETMMACDEPASTSAAQDCPHAREWARQSFADDIAYQLTHAASAARAAIAVALGPSGISPRQMAIMNLLLHSEPLRQQELGNVLSIDRTSMVALIDGLEEIGYVVRETDPTDRRAHAVRLTAAGEEAVAEIRESVKAAQDGFLHTLTEEQRASLLTILGILNAGETA